jgi:hypothetical protein
VLDALVTEARLRFGLDPTDGLQVIAAEGLIGTPIEPSRPVLIVYASLDCVVVHSLAHFAPSSILCG